MQMNCTLAHAPQIGAPLAHAHNQPGEQGLGLGVRLNSVGCAVMGLSWQWYSYLPCAMSQI